MTNLKSIGNLVASNHTCIISSSPEMTINKYGDKEWYLNGKLHREDGPAIEKSNGEKYWYLNGKFHREDGPAVENTNGYKSWWINGELHREDGPAIEYADGTKVWYLNGNIVHHNKKTWDQKVKKSKIDHIMND